MADFRRDNRREGGFKGGHGGHGGGFAGRGGFDRDRNRGPVVMNKAVCDQCHKPCEVPFRPTAGKPVYCNACFSGKKETGFDKGGSFPRNNFNKIPGQTDFGNDIKKVTGEEIKKLLESLNLKMEQLIKMEETPVVKTKKAVKKVSKKK